MTVVVNQWFITVHPSSDGGAEEGVIRLPEELSKLLAGRSVPYSLEKDNSIILYVTKASLLD